MTTPARRRRRPADRPYRRAVIRLAKLLVALVVAVGGLVVGTYAAFVAVEGHPPRWAQVREACAQPGDVAYSDGRYAVFLSEPRVTIALDEEAPQVVVSRAGDGSHGVAIPVSVDTDLSDVTCAWDADGVTVTDGIGISHRVPATVFTGGR